MGSRHKTDDIQEVKFVPSRGNSGSFKESNRTMHNGKRMDLESEWKQSNREDPGFWTGRMKCGVCSVVTFLVFIFIVVFLASSGHKIMEGTVGIYFRGGALQDKVTYPGIHFTMPFITEIERIKIRPRTDTLNPVSAVTKDGIMNTFRNVEVISDVNPQKVVP